MTLKNTTERYGLLSIGMHWLMLLLLIAVYACIELRELYPKGSDPREALKAWHFMLGMLVFLLTLGRIAVRLSGTTPVIVSEPQQWQNGLARLMHLLLYAMMIALPIAGWLTLSAAGKPIPFFGLELPPLMGADKELAGTIKDLHKTVGTTGYFLIGLHALAGLFHHYILRDNALTRMLPKRG
ncbi:MAG: cytochrome b [Gammaproteobacteria bacterium]|nr:cytochrome b [Gammaproteobacteria bacterium]MBU1655907.1 cytochrome b [Gammaproteobacteria bacterium]MBU1961779.1 cytochrome b [Gammaproteobacteria bacterium]